MLGLGSLLLAWARSPQKFQEMHIFPAKSLFFFLFLLFLGFMLHMTACLMEMPIPACLCGGCLFFFFFPISLPPLLFFLLKAKANGQIVLPGEHSRTAAAASDQEGRKQE